MATDPSLGKGTKSGSAGWECHEVGGPGNAHSCPQALHQRWGIHWRGVTQLPGLRCVTQTPEDPFPCVPTKKQAAD